ncbi:MAG: S4 domain-containing protein [Acidobacteriota bacterium]|nr:S4 domain-containing protein [Acidobacteriota bacterium]
MIKKLESENPIARIRLDVWLDVACLFKTRSEAQHACRGGKVDVNAQRAKPHRSIQPGDRLAITRSHGRKQLVVVRTLASHHMPKATARALYEDVTPPLTAVERESYRFGNFVTLDSRRHPSAAMAPDTRQRRALRRLKGR